MKRFIVFAGDDYHPRGGWDDCAGEYDTLEEAEEAVANYAPRHGWWQLVDLVTGEVRRGATPPKSAK